MKRINILIVLALPSVAFAAEGSRHFGVAAPELSMAMITQFGLGLALIVFLIYLLAWVSKKIQGTMKSDHESLKIVGGLAVGSKERLVLVQVHDEQILIGTAPGHISILHVIDHKKIPSSRSAESGKAAVIDSSSAKNSIVPSPLLSDFLAKLNRQTK